MEQYYSIGGGRRLEGTITISGAKNAAVAIIPAAILAGEPCVLENLPDIEDVQRVAVPILRHRIIRNYTAEAEGVSIEQIIDTLK